MNYLQRLFLTCAASTLFTQATEKPNIIVIVADDLGYGDLGFTGNKNIQTPNLDTLAKGGAVFNNFYSPAQVCSPSRAATMTAKIPYKLGIYSFIGGSSGNLTHLPKEEVTLPQVMRKAGYQTAIVGKWHASLIQVQLKNKEIPSMDDYGFDYYFCSDDNAKILDKPSWIRNGKNEGMTKGFAANVVGSEAVHWLKTERDPDKPFIQFVHFYEPHWYVAGPQNMVEHYLKTNTNNEKEAQYFAAVSNVDKEVGNITTTLKELGIDKNTLVLFTSDHGPATLGKGKTDRNYGTAAPYRGKKYGLWDGSVHVPGIAYWPAQIKPGSVIDAPAGSIDWLPTIAEAADVPLPTGLELDGQSHYPLMLGKKMNRIKPLQWHHYNTNTHHKPNPNAVMRVGDYLICGFYAPETQPSRASWNPKHIKQVREGKLVRFELYNLTNDPQQKSDRSKNEPERFQGLKERLIKSHKDVQSQAVGWKGVIPQPAKRPNKQPPAVN
jgi:arylsulfatase A